MNHQIIPGWWYGTCFTFSHLFPYIGNFLILTNIVQRGGSTTNQIPIQWHNGPFWNPELGLAKTLKRICGDMLRLGKSPKSVGNAKPLCLPQEVPAKVDKFAGNVEIAGFAVGKLALRLL